MRSFGILIGTLLVYSATTAAAQTAPQTQPQTSQLVNLIPDRSDDSLGPRTLTAKIVACTDMAVSTPPASPLRIVASHSGDTHQIYALGEIVVLNGGTPQGLAAGQRYFVRRLQLPLYGEPLSAVSQGAIRTAGWITVIAADEHSALARIDHECDAITAGDYLDPFVEPELPAALAPDAPPNFSNLGKVLFGADRRQQFGAGDVLTVDRGSSQGMTMGARVAFYRDRLNATPLVEMGTGVVVEVLAETSKVVVVRAREAVTMGDYFAIKSTPTP